MTDAPDPLAELRRLPSDAWITDDEVLRDDNTASEASEFPDFETWSDAADCPPGQVSAAWQKMRARLDLEADPLDRSSTPVRGAVWRPAVAAALAAGVVLGIFGDRLLLRSREVGQVELNTELVDVLRTRRGGQPSRGGPLATLVVFAPRGARFERYGVQILDRNDEVMTEAWGLVLDPEDLTFTLTIPSDLLQGRATALRLLGATGDDVEVVDEQPLPTLVDDAPEGEGAER